MHNLSGFEFPPQRIRNLLTGESWYIDDDFNAAAEGKTGRGDHTSAPYLYNETLNCGGERYKNDYNTNLYLLDPDWNGSGGNPPCDDTAWRNSVYYNPHEPPIIQLMRKYCPQPFMPRKSRVTHTQAFVAPGML
jgi:hypothetical protein